MQSGQMRRLLLAVALAALAIGAAAALVSVAYLLLRSQSGADGGLNEAASAATEGYRFGFTAYELTHLPNRLLTEVAGWFGEPEVDEAALLTRWFSTREEADRKMAERRLERRLSEAIAAQGLETPLPLFGAVRIVWPPVDMDIGATLRVLAISPRDEVRLARSVLLTADLRGEEFARVEQVVEADGEWSAWVTAIGGVALYPAPIVGTRDQARTLQIMAHEWTHHYLGFHPLGLAYGRGVEMRTINETVADIVGDELGAAAAARSAYREPPVDAAWLAEREERLSATDPILRELRIEVEALLAAGRVAKAEQRMETVRLALIELGRPFRKINQAFLAFRGGYGARASSASPWGTRLAAQRAASGSLAEFVAAVRGIGSPGEADRRLPREAQ